MPTKKTVVAYLAAAFAAGLLAGGVGGYGLGKKRVFAPPPRPQDIATHIVDRLKSKLQLSPDQVEKIRPLVSETAAELETIHAATAERITETFRKLNARQGQFLTPEQKRLLEEMERERQQFFRKRSKGKPAPELSPSAAR